MSIEFYYLNPELKVSSGLFPIIIIGLFIWFLTVWVNNYRNWDSQQCKNGNFYLAPLFGKDSKTAFESCARPVISDEINKITGVFNSQIENSDQMFSNDILGNTTKVNDAMDISTDATTNASNTAVKIQYNLTNIKDILKNVVGSVLLSTHMSNNILSSVADLSTIQNDKSIQKLAKE